MITKSLPCDRRVEEGNELCSQYGDKASRPPDRDTRELFHKPADKEFGERLGWFIDQGVIPKKEVLLLQDRMVENRDYDPRLHTHCCSVGCTATWLSRKLGDPLYVQALALIAGYDHDKGKSRLPHESVYPEDEEYRKANAEEYNAILDTHPVQGYYALREGKSRYARRCALVALLHHRHQARRYPSDQELAELGVCEPQAGILFRVIQYVEVGDSIEASNRYYELPRPRHERMHSLQERMPHLASLIELAFDGITN